MDVMGGPDPTPAEVEVLRRGHAARKEQERRKRQDKQHHAEMAGILGANQDQEADRPVQERPVPERQGDKPDLPARDKRSRWETILAPLVFAILGVAMIVAGFTMYPRTSEAPAPDFPTFMQVTSHFPIHLVNYLVIPLSSGKTEIEILVDLPAGMAHPPAHKPAALFVFAPPSGVSLWHCPRLPCTGPVGTQVSGSWGQTLTFNSMSGSAGEATTYFFVKGPNFGITSNGVTAAAALPQFFWNGPGQPLLYAGYGIHSATAYDWSPPAAPANGSALWIEPLAKGYTAGLTATGVDHSAQSFRDFIIFLAGALIALGGGAILAAIVEALHSRDWDTIRALRST